MIKFFRKIRQKLLSENQFSRYLLYAIGEIFLVVIGILLALQINNWNSYQNDREIEQNVLKSLANEFKINLTELSKDHKLNQASLDAGYALLQENRTELSSSEVDSLIGTALNYATFDARTGVFDETIASGKMRLIQNDSLKTLLSLWTGKLKDLGEDAIIRRDHIVHNASPLFRKHIPYRNFDEAYDRNDYLRELRINPIKVPESNYAEFFSSLEVDGAIYEIYLNQSYTTSNEVTLLRYIEQVISMLESNINNH